MKNKILLNILLLLTSSFSLFASNTGEECDNPYYYGEEEIEAQFQEDQQNLFMQFSASSDSMLIEFFSTGDPLEFEKVYLYQFEDCGNLSLVDSVISTNGFPAAYLLSENLSIGVDYMIEIIRFADKTPQLDFIAKVVMAVPNPCPTSYNNCMELVKNGNFSFASIASPDALNAFSLGEVCEWKSYSTPTWYVYRGTDIHYNNQLPNNNPFAELYDVYVSDPLVQSTYHDGGSIGIDLDIKSGKEYFLSFSLQRTSWTAYSKFETFKAWFINEATLLACPSNMILLDYLLTLSPSDYQEVGIITASQYSATKSTFKFCRTANNNFDRLIFMGYSSTAGSGTIANEGAANLDDVSLLHLDAGPDVTPSYCKSTVIGPSCTLPGATYSWSPTTGLDNPNAARTAVNTFNVATTYTLTMTIPNSGGCTVSDQVVVNSGIPDIKITNENITTVKSNNVFDWTIISDAPWLPFYTAPITKSFTLFENKLIEINGTLTINENVIFRDCLIMMGENAKIDVVGGHLTIDGHNNQSTPLGPTFIRTIRTCDPSKFWDGIYVNGQNPNSALTIYSDPDFFGTGSNFSNSFNGIVGLNDPIIYVDNVTFDRNNRVFTAKSYTANSNASKFTHIYVKCTTPLISASIGEYYPETAILIEDLKDAGLYSPLTTTLCNFYGSGGKVKIINSDYISDTDVFKDFYNHPFFTTFPVSEVAIDILGSKDVTPKEVVIDDAKFISNKFSINSEDDVNLTINGGAVNHFASLNTYYPLIPESKFLKVIDNLYFVHVVSTKIYNVQTGIQFLDCINATVEGVEMDLEYQGDGVNSFTTKTNTNSCGITMNNYSIEMYYIPYASKFVNNTIKHAKYGILAYNGQVDITDNTILDLNDNTAGNPFCFPFPCPATPSWGIRTDNVQTKITGNKVYNDPNNYLTTPRTNTLVTGIEVVNGGFGLPKVNCNNVENTGNGLTFRGYNGGAQVYNNDMKDHTFGFVLSYNGVIGAVGDLLNSDVDTASENRWIGDFSTGSHTMSISSNGGASKLFVMNGTETNPTILNSHRSGSGATILAKDNSLNQNLYPAFCTTRTRIRNNATASAAPGLGNFRMGKSTRGNQPHMVHAIDSASQFNEQLLFFNLSKDSALMNSATWKQFSDSMRTTPIGKAVGKPLNTAGRSAISVGTPTNFDANLALINPIAEHYKNGVALTKLEMSQLQTMAAKCPDYDGLAVYQARAITTALGGNEVFNTCEMVNYTPASSIGGASKRLKDESTQQFPFAIYPNPAKEMIFLNFEVGDQENVIFELYDVLGKQQLIKRLNATNSHQIKLNAVQPGIYFYRIVSNDASMEAGKLIIE